MPPPDDNSGRYSSSGNIDLTANVNLNNNPLDMVKVNGEPLTIVRTKWIYFVDFALKNLPPQFKDSLGNPLPSINKEENHKVTTDLIKSFNTSNESQWAINKAPVYGTGLYNIKGLDFNDFLTINDDNINLSQKYPMTIEDIKAVQTFNQITDSKIFIDGWLRTQTFKLDYPNFYIFVPQTTPSFTPKSPWRTTYKNSSGDGGFDATQISDIKYAMVWGDKRYTIPWKKFLPLSNKSSVNIKLKKDNWAFRIEDLTPYRSQFGDELFFISNPKGRREWEAASNITTPVPSPSQINLGTIKEKTKTNIAKIETKIGNLISKST